MALGDPYISASELKAYGNPAIADAVDDTRIGEVVNAVSRKIERHTGRQFNDAVTPTARVYRPECVDWISVDDFSTTSGLIVKSDTGLDGGYATTIAASFYSALPLNGIVDGVTGQAYREIQLHGGQRFVTSEGRPTVQVTARWGWTAVPADVKEACYIETARIFKRRETPAGVHGFGDFVVRVSREPLDPDAASLLKHYILKAEVA